LNVRAVLVLLEEPADVAVNKAGDADAEWGGGGRVLGRESGGGERRENDGAEKGGNEGLRHEWLLGAERW
jgi:hypothetical protein